jgi:hypothetical protein
MSVSARIFQLGPLLAVGAALTFIWKKMSGGVVFWSAAAASLSVCLVYYVAFVKAFARQHERFYQREVRPRLSREYRDR